MTKGQMPGKRDGFGGVCVGSQEAWSWAENPLLLFPASCVEGIGCNTVCRFGWKKYCWPVALPWLPGWVKRGTPASQISICYKGCVLPLFSGKVKLVLKARGKYSDFLITAFCFLSDVTYLVSVSEVLANLLVPEQLRKEGKSGRLRRLNTPQALVLGGCSNRGKGCLEQGAAHSSCLYIPCPGRGSAGTAMGSLAPRAMRWLVLALLCLHLGEGIVR